VKLRERYKYGRLALFIGAGVSVSCGLPDWKRLADQVVDEAIPVDPRLGQPGHVRRPVEHAQRAHLKGLPPVEALRILRARLGSKFVSVVRRALYLVPPTTSLTVSRIASLVGCSRICNFNYDDLIQVALLANGWTCKTIVEESRFSLLDRETMIFHPHGFLPSASDLHGLPASNDVVLSEDDYHRLYAAPYSWANLGQLALLAHLAVLFVGFSLTDPNTRRLLDIVKEMGSSHTHFALMIDLTLELRRAEAGSWMPTSDVARKLSESSLENRGVFPIWI
jgi:hypothetical protein